MPSSETPTTARPASAAPPAPSPDPATSGLRGNETSVGSVFVSNYPPFSAWSEEALPEVMAKLASEPPAEPAPLGLYMHIPFCRKRCKFCYFRVYTDRNAGEIGRYTDALADEIDLYAGRPYLEGRGLDFVYFGGGTPSYISVDHLEGLVERARAAFSWDDVREVTFECEPGTLTRSKLEAIRGIGVTRLSLGIENFDDRILEINGRAHVSKEIYRVLPWIEEIGFPQLNVDLIAGMVGESWETWRQTVERTIDVGAESITVYQMELPHNARFSRQLQEGGLDEPLADWETKRAWQRYAFERFVEAGYEVSSAYTVVRRDQDEASRFVYRDSLWRGADMVGTGIASFSHVGGLHFQNSASWDDYLEAIEGGFFPVTRGMRPEPGELLTRELILQLKLGRLGTAYFEEKFGVDVLDRFRDAWERLASRDMLRVGDDRVELTREGLLQVDSLLPTFYDERYREARYT